MTTKKATEQTIIGIQKYSRRGIAVAERHTYSLLLEGKGNKVTAKRIEDEQQILDAKAWIENEHPVKEDAKGSTAWTRSSTYNFYNGTSQRKLNKVQKNAIASLVRDNITFPYEQGTMITIRNRYGSGIKSRTLGILAQVGVIKNAQQEYDDRDGNPQTRTIAALNLENQLVIDAIESRISHYATQQQLSDEQAKMVADTTAMIEEKLFRHSLLHGDMIITVNFESHWNITITTEGHRFRRLEVIIFARNKSEFNISVKNADHLEPEQVTALTDMISRAQAIISVMEGKEVNTEPEEPVLSIPERTTLWLLGQHRIFLAGSADGIVDNCNRLEEYGYCKINGGHVEITEAGRAILNRSQ